LQNRIMDLHSRNWLQIAFKSRAQHQYPS
jgi:hypothetical protein